MARQATFLGEFLFEQVAIVERSFDIQLDEYRDRGRDQHAGLKAAPTRLGNAETAPEFFLALPLSYTKSFQVKRRRN